jgi:DNA primase
MRAEVGGSRAIWAVFAHWSQNDPGRPTVARYPLWATTNRHVALPVTWTEAANRSLR